MRVLRTVPKEKLLSFYAHVGEFSKILIEGGHWRVFGLAKGISADHSRRAHNYSKERPLFSR